MLRRDQSGRPHVLEQLVSFSQRQELLVFRGELVVPEHGEFFGRELRPNEPGVGVRMGNRRFVHLLDDSVGVAEVVPQKRLPFRVLKLVDVCNLSDLLVELLESSAANGSSLIGRRLPTRPADNSFEDATMVELTDSLSLSSQVAALSHAPRVFNEVAYRERHILLESIVWYLVEFEVPEQIVVSAASYGVVPRTRLSPAFSNVAKKCALG